MCTAVVAPTPRAASHSRHAGCLVTFNDAVARDAYLVDPEHVAFTGAAPPFHRTKVWGQAHARAPRICPDTAATTRAEFVAPYVEDVFVFDFAS